MESGPRARFKVPGNAIPSANTEFWKWYGTEDRASLGFQAITTASFTATAGWRTWASPGDVPVAMLTRSGPAAHVGNTSVGTPGNAARRGGVASMARVW